jgi:eukaryotic-like serine/threonine-protein kinase
MSADGPDPRTADPGPSPDPDTTSGQGTEPPPTRPAEAVIRQRIGHYEIVKTLGRGGMSTVYLARDDRIGRDVALKVIPAGADADPNDLARFREEAEAVARLQHPNIVHLYEVGEASGMAYLAMEYVPGGNLYKRINRGGPLDPIDAARLVGQLARAAHCLHTHGIIHRDLKPSNILLSPHSAVPGPQSEGDRPATEDSGLGTPKIGDFGLAKQLNKSLRLTQSGVAVGTPHYMAPEQAKGHGDLVGPAADVYSLGAILFECLVGQPPFGGSSPMETMEQVVHKKPIPPSHLRDGVPPDLEAICLRCLEKSPSRRYPTAGSLADALDLFLAGKPVTEPDPPTERIVIPRRSRVPLALAAAGAGVALVLLTALVTAFLVGRVHRTEVQTAREEMTAATRAERRARLEEAVEKCERGDIAEGVRRIKALGPDDTLPVKELLAAWEGYIPARTALQPPTPAAVVAVAPSGKLTATADGNVVRVWQLADARPLGESWTADGRVTALAWEDGGTRLAVGTDTGKVVVGNGSESPFAPVTVVEPGDLPVTAVALEWIGVRVAFGTAPVVREYDDEDGPTTEELPTTDPVSSVGLGPEGRIAVATRTGSVRLYDPDGRRWQELPPDGDATAVAYSPDGNAVAVGTNSGSVRLWDAVARAPLTEAIGLDGPVTSLSIGMSASDYTILAAGRESAVAVVCRRSFVGPPIRVRGAADEQVVGVAFSPGGRSLYVTTPAGVSVWKVGDAGLARMKGISAWGRYASWLNPGRFSNAVPVAARGGPESLLVAGSGGRVYQIDPSESKDLSAATAGNEVTAVAAGPAGGVCAFGRGGDKATILRHWAHGLAAPASEAQTDGPVRQAAFLPSGLGVVLGCENGKVHVVDPVTGRDLRAPWDAHAPVLAVAANPDGTQILAGCADGTAHLWDHKTGAELLVVRHQAEVRGVAFAGDDLLTASADGTARRWHAGTGLPLGPPMHHADAINALAADRQLVATGGRDRTVRVWRLP